MSLSVIFFSLFEICDYTGSWKALTEYYEKNKRKPRISVGSSVISP